MSGHNFEANNWVKAKLEIKPIPPVAAAIRVGVISVEYGIYVTKVYT